MNPGVEIPFHEAIISNLGSADRFLEQHPACVFLVGKQLIDCLPAPLRPACWRWDASPHQTRSDFSKAVPNQIPFRYPAYHLGFIGVYHQFTVRADCVSVASTACHLGTTVLKTSPQASLDTLTFLNHVHNDLPFCYNEFD